jgi:ATP-dependent protease HslVU (ClpYQ) ATPase subunit
MENTENNELTPKQIVEKLNQYIIGQEKAKKAVAVALRNRFRRLKLPEEIRDEVAPKNILMIGPTGVGKTEIARRLAKLCGAPFLKVEATKYTEVGYVGRDVESMIRDLMAVGYSDVKAEMEDQLREKSQSIVEERLLDLLLPGTGKKDKEKQKKEASSNAAPDGGFITQAGPNEITIDLKKVAADLQDSFGQVIQEDDGLKSANIDSFDNGGSANSSEGDSDKNSTREKFRQWLREGRLEEREVDLMVSRQQSMPNMEIIAGGSIDDLQNSMQGIINLMNGGGRPKKRSVTIKEARKILTEEVLDSMVDHDKIADEAKKRVEQSGIIFIDEIDKIAKKQNHNSRDVSGESVQQGMLKLLEGSDIEVPVGASSKNVMVPTTTVNTRNILFICGGAFSGLDEIIKRRLKKQTSIGFNAELKDKFDNEKNIHLQVTIEDLKKFGMIPEFIGRLPMICGLESLTEEMLVNILKEPKNAIIKQYQKLLRLDEVDLQFTEGALKAIAQKAMEKDTGARALRAIIDEFMLDIMYEIPKDENIGKVTITEDYINKKGGPIIELRSE